MNRIGLIILIGIFIVFYLVTTFFLDRRNINRNIPVKEDIVTDTSNNYDDEKEII